MNTEYGNGGPAFPRSNGAVGMSTRAYFAGQALPAILQDWLAHWKTPMGRDGDLDEENAARIAAEAYLVADAMIAEEFE